LTVESSAGRGLALDSSLSTVDSQVLPVTLRNSSGQASHFSPTPRSIELRDTNYKLQITNHVSRISPHEPMRIKIIGDNNCARATRHLLRLAGFAVTEFLPVEAITSGPHAGYAITIDLAPATNTPDSRLRPPNTGADYGGLAHLRPDSPAHHHHASASEEADRLHRDASSPAFVRPTPGRTTAGKPAFAEAAAEVPSLVEATAARPPEAPAVSRSEGGKRKWWLFGVLLLVGGIGLMRVRAAASPARVSVGASKIQKAIVGLPAAGASFLRGGLLVGPGLDGSAALVGKGHRLKPVLLLAGA
jgi:hypothetical protein